MEVMVIKIKTCHLSSVLTKSKLTWKTRIIFQNSDTWKIELTTAINIISSKNTKEKGVRMYWTWFYLPMPTTN